MFVSIFWMSIKYISMKKMTFAISKYRFLGTFHFHAKQVESIIQNSQKNINAEKIYSYRWNNECTWMSLQFSSILPGTVTSRHAGKRRKNETEIEDKKISGFCSLKLYLHWKEDIVYIVNIVVVITYTWAIWY